MEIKEVLLSKELVDRLMGAVRRAGLQEIFTHKKQMHVCLRAITREITQILIEGKAVRLFPLGTLYTDFGKKTTHYSPFYKKRMQTGRIRRLYFRPAQKLKSILKKNKKIG